MPPLSDRRSLAHLLDHLPFQRLTTLQEAQRLCDLIGYCVVPDVRMQLWDLTATAVKPLTIQGYVSSPWALNALHKACERLGMECDTGSVRTLPCNGLGEKRFGLVTRTECPIFSSPDCSERADTALLGETLFLLRQAGPLVLAHAHNGYIGWVQSLDFRAIDSSEWVDWSNRDRALFVVPQEVDGLQIPGGTELPMVDTDEVLLPTGSILRVHPDLIASSLLYNNQQRAALVSMAKSLLATPYVWGGTSTSGIDCSGFTRYSYRGIGVHLPRDADQQFLSGRICAIPKTTETLAAGDLLFFAGLNGGIGHVGMAMGNGEFIHAKGGRGVIVSAVEELGNPETRFLLAKRIIR